jgi:hypothetical protein
MTKVLAALLAIGAGGAQADSVLFVDGGPEREEYFAPYEVWYRWTCRGEQGQGWLWHPSFGVRHFFIMAVTPGGITWVVDDVLFRSSMGTSCHADGTVVED